MYCECPPMFAPCVTLNKTPDVCEPASRPSSSSGGPDVPRCVSCGGFVRCSGRRIQHFGQHLGFSFSHSEKHLRLLVNSCSLFPKGVQKHYSAAGMKPAYHTFFIFGSYTEMHSYHSIFIFNDYIKIPNHVFLKILSI